jgi:glutamine amidotransferase
VIEQAKNGKPILGVCVGMQMLFEKSEEFGTTRGLGLLRGSVQRFSEDLVVPHVGWNQVRQTQSHSLLSGIEDDAFFYFVHSYFCAAEEPTIVVAETDYGSTYPSIVAKENVAGVQFHPEKSQKAGLQLLRNFAGMS